MLELPPLSLYIHVPWCVRKCPYCDFNSHEASGNIPEEEYVQALLADFRSELRNTEGRRIQSVFIGGGTPSLFSPGAYKTLLATIDREGGLADNAEITLEANPGTAEAERFAGYRSAGINRLSLGIQSFSDDNLGKLGRVHNAAQARTAIAIARDAGYDNLNLDLMYGLSRQTAEGALADLEQACAFEPQHISWYQLTLEPNTVFFRRPPPLPDEETLMNIQEQGLERLASYGYQRYEISAYAQESHRSVHNLNYWRFGDYIGIGAGAHGKLTSPGGNLVTRQRKVKQPAHYLRVYSKNSHDSIPTAAPVEKTGIASDQLTVEFMMNVLRTTEGFTVDQFQARTGLPFSAIGNRVECLLDSKLLQTDGRRIFPSAKGHLFLNSLLEEFL
ncbi:MAG: radical SAM family heme chaperone HemW [Pseudohongiellaceae bacterium]